ncbi:MAG TPA: DUF2269 family protein, partial [Anaerolineales bacterium]|nr:DUF2269 family protein [Anaerolineales bacterium]
MNKVTNSLIKTLHILFACLWLGASASLVLLQCARGWSEDGQLLLALNQNFSLLDIALIIPGALGSAITGYVICETTSWGFTRYRWIIVKAILTLSAILIGTALLGPWQMQMVKLSAELEDLRVSDASYDLIRSLFTLVGALQVLLLICNLA